jgi:serine/threonine protein kinase
LIQKQVSPENSFVQKDTEKDFLLLLDLIKGMLIYEPKERISPSEALQHEFLKKI